MGMFISKNLFFFKKLKNYYTKGVLRLIIFSFRAPKQLQNNSKTTPKQLQNNSDSLPCPGTPTFAASAL